MADLEQAIAAVKALVGGDAHARLATEPPMRNKGCQAEVLETAAGRFCTAFEAPLGEFEFQLRQLGTHAPDEACTPIEGAYTSMMEVWWQPNGVMPMGVRWKLHYV